jgi:acid phosphatase type 7
MRRAELCLLAALLTPSSTPARAEDLHSLAGPYLQAPTESSITVMWVADHDSRGSVEYGTGEALNRTANGSEDGLLEAGRIHRVTLEGLTPGTTYRYRIVTEAIADFQPYKVTFGEPLRDDVRTFKTLDRGRADCAFVVLNDNHERTELLRARLARAGKEPYDLVFYNGDMLDHVDSEAQILDRVLAPSSEVFARSLPFVWVRGNHETRGVYARALKQYVGSPNGRFFYSFDHGPVHFLVLDSGEDKADDHREYGGLVAMDAYRRLQAEWLKAEVESDAFKKAAFRVVLMHQPPFALDGPPPQHYGREHAKKVWGPLLDRGVDLLIGAHLHKHGVLDPEPGVHDYPVVIGGGPKEGQGTVVRVQASRDRLEVTMTGDDGATLATRTVKRRQPR